MDAVEAQNQGYGKMIVQGAVIVFGVGLLAAIALPCYIGAQSKAKEAAVKGNMRTMQIAAESYASDNKGIYPRTLSELSAYFPGGSNKIGGSAGVFPSNPIDGSANSAVEGASKFSVEELRSSNPSNFEKHAALTPGRVEFVQLENGKSYAIVAAGPSGSFITGVGGHPLVLSNQ